MSKYIVAVFHYFSGYQNFTIEATNKSEALEKAKKEAIIRGNYIIDDAKVIKKLQNKSK